MRMRRRSAGISGLALVFGMSVLTGCRQQEAASQKALTPVGVSAVQMYQAGGGVRYSASIMPNTQVDLAFKSAGYIDSVMQVMGADGHMRNVQQGDWIAKVTVLARVRQNDYASKVNQAKAQTGPVPSHLEPSQAGLRTRRQSLRHPERDQTRL
jgi:hypothetical protein